MTIYKAFIDARIETENHESDLYVEVTAASTAILLRFPVHFDNATRFRDSHGKLYYDIPFAYEPFWVEKSVRRDRANLTIAEIDRLDSMIG